MRRWKAILVAVVVFGSIATSARLPVLASTVPLCTGPVGNAFFDPPATLPPGGPGTLVSCRETTVDLGANAAPHRAFAMIYVSTDVTGARVATSGMLLIPTAPWTGTGSRPVVGFAPGTHGMATKCAVSRQLIAGTEPQADSIVNALGAGFAIAVADYEGYLNGQTHTYMVGPALGHAVLDGVRASFQIAQAGLSPTTKVGLWGYSEGGAGSTWAAELAGSYAPTLDVVGLAAGGVPGDLKVTARLLNGNLAAAFMLGASLGFATAFPALPFDQLLNDAGRAAKQQATQLCLFDAVAKFAFTSVADFTTDKLSLDRFFALVGTDGISWSQRLDQAKLGVDLRGANKVTFPVFMFRSIVDEAVPTQTEDDTRHEFCAAGLPVQTATYLGEHVIGDFMSQTDVISFLADRFAGKAPRNDC
ncbi:MAG TPA: lipase family protein [Rugosimonospora sp.]|nr:lipase family protein [Rugosimonospora sp.]